MPAFATLRDNFDDNSLNPTKWKKGALNIVAVEQNQRLEMILPASFTNSGVESVNTNYNLIGSFVQFELYNLTCNFEFVIFGTNTAFEINIAAGNIFFAVASSTDYLYTVTIPYSSTNHRWLRVRESSGVVYYDTSANGYAWTTRGSYTYAIPDTTLQLQMYTYNADGLAYSTYLDNFNYVSNASTISGTIAFSGGSTRPTYEPHRAISGTIAFSGTVGGYIFADTSIVEKKTFMYKVYDEDDNFLGVWDDVIDEPNWSQEINTTGSAQTILLARNSDSLTVELDPLLDNTGASILDNNSFEILTSAGSRNKVGPGSNVNHNYRVDIYIFYGFVDDILDNFGLPIEDNLGEYIQGTNGAPNGVRKFSGFISEINTNYGDNENTQVQLMSYGYDLDQYPVVDGSGNTTVAFTTYQPSDIVRDGLDQFTDDAAGESYTTYSPSSIENTSSTVNYTFRNNTYKELLETAVKLAPYDWFYYVGLGDNLVRFKQKPTTAAHTFYLGKHIKNLNLRSYIGGVVNDVLFTGGGDPALYKRYTETPLAGTRRGLSKMSDIRVTLESSADILAEGEIEGKKGIQYRSAVEILDKTYDIESIELGDLVAFRNFDNHVDLITMQIVALNYTPDVISLALDTLPVSTPKRLEELRKSLDAQENAYVPAAPDV